MLGCVCLSASAQAETTTVYYSISSGTGFFINREYLVTNAHVVRGCEKVSLAGAVSVDEAQVVTLDDEHDLALIRSSVAPQEFAPLRLDIDNMKAGDNILLYGYPGEKGIRGEATSAAAKVEKMEYNSIGKPWQFYITDVVQQGNSGGPVLDNSGNVIGVTVGMMELKTVNPYTQEQYSQRKLGVAISLRALQYFVEGQGVYIQWGGSNLLTYENGVLEDNAKRYIVNVQCRKQVDPPTDIPQPPEEQQQ